jgi:hypothetical protein
VLGNEDAEGRARNGVVAAVEAAGAVDGDDGLISVDVEIEAIGAGMATCTSEDYHMSCIVVIRWSFDDVGLWVSVTVYDVEEAGRISGRRSARTMIAANMVHDVAHCDKFGLEGLYRMSCWSD